MPEFLVPQNAPQTLERPADRVRGLYRAMLESWAGDCLRLRASGLDRPSWRTTTTGPARPLGVRASARRAA